MSGDVASDPAPSSAGLRLAVGAGLLSALFSLLYQSPGVVLSPDGWGYWEGSISLLGGAGYRWLQGQVITIWPPGFSLYLATWQGLLGNAAGTLAIAQAVAVGVATSLWVATANVLSGPREPGLRRVALAFVFALALPIALREILSESLFMALFSSAALLAVRQPRSARGWMAAQRRELARVLLFVVVLFALLLTRHVGVAYVPALGWLCWSSLSPGSERLRRALVVGSVAAIVAWVVVRLLLRQAADHPHIALDAGVVSRVAGNLQANALAIWQLGAPVSAAGALAAVSICLLFHLGLRTLGGAMSTRIDGPERGGAGSGLGVAAALSAAAGAVAWARYGVGGQRFVLPVAALLLLLLGQSAEHAARPRLRCLASAVLASLALIQLGRGGYWVRHALRSEPVGLAWNLRLVPPCSPGASSCRLAPDAIAPPDYPWIPRSFPRDPSSSAGRH